MTIYCAVDLHSNNTFPVIVDDNDHIAFHKRLANKLGSVLSSLAPYKAQITAVAVESTFNWYWLVDGLMDDGYEVKLVNTSAVQQYNGIKHADDENDAFHLAHLMRLGNLPAGYIYPKETRALRDLCRKCLQLVRHRVTRMLSTQNQIWRSTGENITNARFKKADFSLLDMLDNIPAQMALMFVAGAP